MMATLLIQICPQSYESRPLSDYPSSPLILQLETEARTKWHNFDNNMRLSDRAQDIERWQRELEKTLREVDAEAATLQERKNAKRSKKNLFHETESRIYANQHWPLAMMRMRGNPPLILGNE